MYCWNFYLVTVPLRKKAGRSFVGVPPVGGMRSGTIDRFGFIGDKVEEMSGNAVGEVMGYQGGFVSGETLRAKS